jgi:hypothetical protein
MNNSKTSTNIKTSSNNKDSGNSFIDSTILNLETLSKRYETILIQYQQAQADYDSYERTNPTKQNFKNLKGMAFWGSTGLSQGTANKLNECIARCSSNTKCSGATFNSDKKYCWLRSGSGQPIAALPNDYAIIPEKFLLLNKLQKLNNELITINQRLLKASTNALPLYKSLNNNITDTSSVLNQNYNKLTDERAKIEKAISEHKELEQTYDATSLETNYYYYWYMFSFIIFIILIYIVVKTTASSVMSSSVTQYGGKNFKKFLTGYF